MYHFIPSYNSVIDNKLYCGEYPCRENGFEWFNFSQHGFDYLKDKEKINLFVDLTYFDEKISRNCISYKELLDKDTEYISFPIEDNNIVNNDLTYTFCCEILDYLKEGKVIYIHCFGGHGRAELICSIVYGLYHNVDGEKAMTVIQEKHHARKEFYDKNRWKHDYIPDSPTTLTQKRQVITILNSYK